jgi:hypothetical protein
VPKRKKISFSNAKCSAMENVHYLCVEKKTRIIIFFKTKNCSILLWEVVTFFFITHIDAQTSTLDEEKLATQRLEAILLDAQLGAQIIIEFKKFDVSLMS